MQLKNMVRNGMMKDNIKTFLQWGKDYINKNDKDSWVIFYETAFTPSISGLSSFDIAEMNKMLLQSGINPIEKLKYIPERFYYGRDDLTEIKIPNYVEGISIYAFKDCENLKKIYIPKSVKFIDGGAFDGGPTYRHIQYEGSLNNWLSMDIDSNDGLTEDDYIEFQGN